MMHVVKITDFGSNPSASDGLTLDFKKIFLRDAVPPNETPEIEISSETFEEWATHLQRYIE